MRTAIAFIAFAAGMAVGTLWRPPDFCIKLQPVIPVVDYESKPPQNCVVAKKDFSGCHVFKDLWLCPADSLPEH